MKTIHRISVLVLFSTIILLGSCAVSQGVQLTTPVGRSKSPETKERNAAPLRDCPHSQSYKNGMQHSKSYSNQGKYVIFCHKWHDDLAEQLKSHRLAVKVGCCTSCLLMRSQCQGKMLRLLEVSTRQRRKSR